MIKKIIDRVFLNWRTSIAGLFMLLMMYLVYMNKVDAKDFALMIGALASAGFFWSKDSIDKNTDK
jgi:hypothetical protein